MHCFPCVFQRSADFPCFSFKIGISQPSFLLFCFYLTIDYCVFILCFFLSCFFTFVFFFPRRLKETSPDSTEDSIPDSKLYGFSVFHLFSRCSKCVLSKSALEANLRCFCFFSLTLLLSLCFPVALFLLFCYVLLICFFLFGFFLFFFCFVHSFWKHHLWDCSDTS